MAMLTLQHHVGGNHDLCANISLYTVETKKKMQNPNFALSIENETLINEFASAGFANNPYYMESRVACPNFGHPAQNIEFDRFCRCCRLITNKLNHHSRAETI